jgi:hypothetical protein
MTNDIEKLISEFKTKLPIVKPDDKIVDDSYQINLLHKQVVQLENAMNNGHKASVEEEEWLVNAYELLLKTGNI